MTTPELRERRTSATLAWESFLSGGTATGVPTEVVDSWRRSADRVPVEVAAAPVDDDLDAVRHWSASAVGAAFAAVAPELAGTADTCDYVAAVTDRGGRIVWSSAGAVMRERAAAVNFVPGGHWDEASVGTNALDLALRQGRPASVYSAEHFSPAVHGWVCYAAPITHPVTGDVLGVIDLSSTWDRAHPMALATVTALARSVATLLGRDAAAGQRSALSPGMPPGGSAAADRPSVGLRLLGRGEVDVGGVRVLLPPRQVEILAALAQAPTGLALEGLHAAVYGDAPVSLSTLKAEMSRLRRCLGTALASRPYRLTVQPECDALHIEAALRRGDVVAAVHAYTGSLLPQSESPVLVDWRHRLDVAIRSAVLTGRDANLAVELSDRLPDDAELAHLAWVLLPSGDPRRHVIAGRLSLLEGE